MKNLLPAARTIASLLTARGETLAVAESSTGGLISAALIAVPGASAYFLGGAIVYTLESRRTLLDLPDDALGEIRASTEPYALLVAQTIRQRLRASWGIAETGASGPTGNRYGDRAGHVCLAVSGRVERAVTIETGLADRVENMDTFATAALALLAEALEA
jgi:PncC family amidohydrolase